MSYSKVNNFDVNNKKRIYNILIAKGHYIEEHNDLMNCIRKKFSLPISGSTFYSQMSDILDNLLIYFVNNEISACFENRGPLYDLLNESWKENRTKNYEIEYKMYDQGCKDLENKFVNHTNHIIGSNYLDATLNLFSVFELWIIKIYDYMRKDYDLFQNKKSKLLSYIDDFNLLEPKESEFLDKRERILKKIMNDCSLFVSGKGKTDYVFKELRQYDYRRNLSEDRNIVDFIRAKRNTVHNLGFNLGKSKGELEIKGSKVILDSNKPSYTTDYNTTIYLCNELVDIYKEVISTLKIENIGIYIDDSMITEAVE